MPASLIEPRPSLRLRLDQARLTIARRCCRVTPGTGAGRNYTRAYSPQASTAAAAYAADASAMLVKVPMWCSFPATIMRA